MDSLDFDLGKQTENTFMKWKVLNTVYLENLRSSLSVIMIEPLLNECFFRAPYVGQLGLRGAYIRSNSKNDQC